jgi:streptogramin lyase
MILTQFTGAGAFLALALGSNPGRTPLLDRQVADSLPSNRWLSILPAGIEKQRFILDCTGCHQFDERIARNAGRPRAYDDWKAAIDRMLGFAGASTGFPVIAHGRNSAETALWLMQHAARDPEAAAGDGKVITGAVTEFEMPVGQDLPHDVALAADGGIVVTGMFSHRLFRLDPATGRTDEIAIPVPNANPRAIEVAANGDWWVVLGQPRALARYRPSTREWETFPMGFYAHSVALDSAGRAFANGHFTRDPELLRWVTPAGAVDSVVLPRHPTMGSSPGGPVPYEIRAAPDGKIWMSELQGSRLISFDPRSRAVRAVDMPREYSGPRRFDIDREGILWIPSYATNELVRYDPRSNAFTSVALPVADAVPYVVRVDPTTSRVWIGNSAADEIFAYDPAGKRFTRYALPSRGALVRHLAVNPKTQEVWIAYGASPGRLSSRIARLTP